MKSTGEVMGIDASFGVAFAKAQLAAGTILPLGGTAFLSLPDEDKTGLLPVAQRLVSCGFKLVATSGTAQFLSSHGVPVEPVRKVHEGSPHIVDAIRAGQIHMVINTPRGSGAHQDSFPIRRSALECRVPYFTTVAGALAAAEGIQFLQQDALSVTPLQDYHSRIEALTKRG
jgi:carbamoyl-phosphate synthase large subunit